MTSRRTPWRCIQVYSYFEKGCRIKCTRQPRKVLGGFRVHCFSKKLERMAGEAMDMCLPVLKESSRSRFDSYSVRNSVLNISHITFRDCRVYTFSDNLSRNSCRWAGRLCRSLTPRAVHALCVWRDHKALKARRRRRLASLGISLLSLFSKTRL